MILSEQEKQDIRKKYEDVTSPEVLNYLKRHFPVGDHEWSVNGMRPRVISIEDREYWIEGHKKFLVNKLSSILEEIFPSVEKSVLRRTVKYYLDILK